MILYYRGLFEPASKLVGKKVINIFSENKRKNNEKILMNLSLNEISDDIEIEINSTKDGGFYLNIHNSKDKNIIRKILYIIIGKYADKILDSTKSNFYIPKGINFLKLEVFNVSCIEYIDFEIELGN